MFIFSSWLIFKILKSKNTAMGLIFTITLVIISHFYAMELSSTSTDIIVNMLITYLLLCCFFEDDIKKLYLPLTISPLFCITFKEFESINIDETTFFAPKEKGQCFDREQPCSPNICRNLKLRGNSLKDGFKIKQE